MTASSQFGRQAAIGNQPSAGGDREILVDVRRVSKTFITGLRSTRWSRDQVTALSDISFTIYAGESIGIIGANGAGKTTLLRAIGGTTPVDDGQIIRHVTPRMVLSLGGSFLPQLTGRENISMYGSFLGIRQAALKREFDQIVDFAELAAVIDEPLRDYSAGMRARLAFAIATHGQPRLVCLDEVIGAGDEYFQDKSARRMQQLTATGTTFIITSHNTPRLTKHVDRVLELDQGRLIKDYRL